MASLAEFLGALDSFKGSIREFATHKAVSGATDKVAEIDTQVKDETEKFQAKRQLATDLSARLLALGASGQQVSQASAIFSPKQFGSVQEMALEGALTGNTGLLDNAERAQSLLDKPEQARFDASQATTRRGQDLSYRASMAGIQAAKNKEPNETQFKDATFSRRMEQSDSIFSALEEDLASGAIKFDPSGNFVGVSKSLPKALQSKELQQFQQARDNFITAALRKESGAAIAESEYEMADQQYFAQPGDTPEVLSRKAANRKQIMEGLKASAGPALEKVPYVDPNPKRTQRKKIDAILSNPKLDPAKKRQLLELRGRLEE